VMNICCCTLLMTLQRFEEPRLARVILSLSEIAETNADKAIPLLRACIHSFS